MKENLKTVKEVSDLCGVSVRTLHYYDEIGLLSPSTVTDAGYRLYGEEQFRRLAQILFYRELEFSLADIREMLGSPNFDSDRALSQQIELLKLKKEHIEKLLQKAENMKKKGGIIVDFSSFDKSKLEEYAARAKEEWGQTDAFREYEKKTENRTEAEEKKAGDGLMNFFVEFGKIREAGPDSAEAQELVKSLQNYISEHYYTCTNPILLSLGQMYAAGGEFTENIDKAGGAGTAEFVAGAIKIACKAE